MRNKDGTVMEGSIEDAPNEVLLELFTACESPGQQAYLASLLVDRGACCTAADCTACDALRGHAVTWKRL